eukprot:12406279-Karenia_brevis.AAC.1
MKGSLRPIYIMFQGHIIGPQQKLGTLHIQKHDTIRTSFIGCKGGASPWAKDCEKVSGDSVPSVGADSSTKGKKPQAKGRALWQTSEGDQGLQLDPLSQFKVDGVEEVKAIPAAGVLNDAS